MAREVLGTVAIVGAATMINFDVRFASSDRLSSIA